MGMNEGGSELSGDGKVIEVIPSELDTAPTDTRSVRELDLEAHALRRAKLRRYGLVMLGGMAGALLLVGALGSIKWENELTQALYTNADHRYALAALNVSSGLIFCIALIGLYLPAAWGLKLNVIGCGWYVVGTLVIEVFEGDKIVWTESMADVVFWGSFPIVQIVCILVGSSRNPALVGGQSELECANA
ncbi:MAG: hypothetical protein QGG42_00495 [Phycisphaerae bacterium]|jgi:hypothetical protein|nr:hypothetical protein [Phycisphaerae bacterium]